MRRKKVWRYYCDYCKKANCSGGSMSKHELGCTLNPTRVCGMCKLVEAEQLPIQRLLALLPDPADYRWGDGGFSSELTAEANAHLPKLRKAAGRCPACIMAAIRQRGIPVTMVTDFNFTEESNGAWWEFNNRQGRPDCCGE